MELGEQIAGLEADLEEVSRVLKLCGSQRVRDVLSQEKKKMENELNQKLLLNQRTRTVAGERTEAPVKGYTVRINSYGWDQSDKFVKIYITLKDVQKVPEHVQLTFTDRSFSVLIKDLEGKNHEMTINNLLWPIAAEESSKKVKTDMLIVMCRKKTVRKWECLTEVEKQTKDKDKSSYEENADPGEGLMKMLKKIYSDGDDEMKRTINKAWAESQDQKSRGDDFHF